MTTDRDRTLRWIVLFAVLKVLVHSLVNWRYGFHRDELQFVADARHLAWGYVAYPPLTPFFARVALTLFGPSLVALRLVAALVQSGVIVVAALLARTLGGSRFAQWAAALVVALSPLSLVASSLFQYVTFDVLWWVLVAFFMARMLATDDQRWWLAVGAVIGLGVETKYSMAFLVAGVVIAVLASPALRRHLASRWLWAGAALSILIAAPNLLWQMQHDWISLEFLRHIHARDIRWGRTDHFLVEQLYVPASPFSMPIWVAGIAGLIAAQRLRRFQPLLWLAVVPFVLFVFAKGRGYYTGGIYPLLGAAGAVTLEPFVLRHRRAATAAAILLIVGAATAVPFTMPVAPACSPLFATVIRVNNDFREELGWEELTAEVARVFQSLPAEERAKTAIFCGNYGEAGALDLYGSRYGLPRPICATNSFWLRGYGDGTAQSVIVLGKSEEDVRESCASVTPVGRVTNRYGITNEETGYANIYLCRGLKVSWPQIWASSRSFG